MCEAVGNIQYNEPSGHKVDRAARQSRQFTAVQGAFTHGVKRLRERRSNHDSDKDMAICARTCVHARIYVGPLADHKVGSINFAL
jgi:hypothetical protein